MGDFSAASLESWHTDLNEIAELDYSGDICSAVVFHGSLYIVVYGGGTKKTTLIQNADKSNSFYLSSLYSFPSPWF